MLLSTLVLLAAAPAVPHLAVQNKTVEIARASPTSSRWVSGPASSHANPAVLTPRAGT